MADERFDFGARRLSQRLDRPAALADDDALLAVALHVEGGSNINRAGGLAEFFDGAGDAVRKLLAQQFERRLAHELRREKAQRLGGDLVRVVVERALGQPGPERAEQRGEAFPRHRRHHHSVARADGRTGGRCNEIGLRVHGNHRPPRSMG